MPTPTGRTCCLSKPPPTTGAHPDPAQSPPPRPRGTGLVCLTVTLALFILEAVKSVCPPGYSRHRNQSVCADESGAVLPTLKQYAGRASPNTEQLLGAVRKPSLNEQ